MLASLHFLFLTLILSACDGKVKIRNNETENIVCGDILGVQKNPIFLISSPNYPDNYTPNLNCEMTVQGGNCTVSYKFHFLDFDVENSPGCSRDRIEIDKLDAICGQKNGTKEYFTKNGSLTFKFITDSKINGRGFKIMVEKIDRCQNNPQYFLTSNLKSCSAVGQSKNFFLKSPSFPTSMSFPNNCVYRIQKFSSEICRIRIKFHFFWFGNSKSCIEGSLKMDGKLICGCKKELKIISTFPENFKIIQFESMGIVQNSYSGFLAEVFQDECPKKIGKNEDSKTFPTHSIIRRFYLFTYPEDGYFSKKEKEEVDYVDTKDLNLNTMEDYNTCLYWNQIQFEKINSGKNVQSGISKNNWMENGKNCVEIHQFSGLFLSPGYPFYFPGNLNMCYRFFRLPGQCGLKMKFLDFRLPYSSSCALDRLQFSSIEGAFCGKNLWNEVVTIDFQRRNFEDVLLQSRRSTCLQGFKAIFEQISCEQTTTVSPLPPITRIWPITTTPTPENCGGVFREENFILTNKLGSLECHFFIEKYSAEVCRLEMNFEKGIINCPSEILLINGDEFCGDYTNKRIFLPMGNIPVEVIYKRMPSFTQPIGFKIRILQDSESCIGPEPPAQISK